MGVDRRTLNYAVALTVGVLFVTPAVGLGLSALGLPLTPALLGTLAAVFGTFGFTALVAHDVHRALTVSILVLMTVGANVPLGARPPGLTIGPDLFLVDIVLLVLLAITLRTWDRKHLGLAHALLAGYVIWVFALVVLAPGPRPDAMFWYATHVLRFVLVFTLVSRAVVEEWVTGYGALGAMIITVIGHGLVASIQLATGPIESLTVLGFNPRAVATLGPFPTGPYIGGFTGGAPLASLVVIAIPILFALVFSDRIPRVLPLAGVVWLAFLLQLTAWDAARGALLVALYAGFVVFGWWLSGVLWDRGDALVDWCRESRLRNPVLLLPPLAAAAVWQFTRSSTNPGHEPMFLDPELGQETLGSISVPGFSTRNLGIRLHQYVGGTDVFLQYPLTGLGGANYNYVALEYADRTNMIHNFYIGAFAENGLVGGTLLFSALGVICLGLWKTAATEDSPLWLGLLVGLVGFFALQSFQPQYIRPVTMASLFGILGVSYGQYLRRRSVPESTWDTVFEGSLIQRALSSAMVSQAPVSVMNTLERTLDTSWERSYLRAALLKTMK